MTLQLICKSAPNAKGPQAAAQLGHPCISTADDSAVLHHVEHAIAVLVHQRFEGYSLHSAPVYLCILFLVHLSNDGSAAQDVVRQVRS